MKRYFNNKFSDTEISTTNPNFFEKKFQRNGKEYHFNFWDTAGQENFNALNAIYYQGAVAALIVYDVNIFDTFEKVKKWVNELKQMLGNDVIFVIAGNKFDLVKSKDELNKNKQIIDSYVASEKVRHFYTSAKSGENLTEMFDYLIQQVLEKIKNDPKKPVKGKLKLTQMNGDEFKGKQKEKCC